MFFQAKPPVSQDEFDWLLACFAWLRTVLDDADIHPELITSDHPALRQARNPEEMFEAVRSLCGMRDWPCRLKRIDDRSDFGHAGVVAEGVSACGTFSVESGEAVIRYAASLATDADAIAATFAHELCHYLLMNAGDPPGGPDLMEHATDCAAAYLGFGVLLANNAREFGQWTDGEWFGWRSSTKGYLSEQALVTATALFARLHGHDLSPAYSALKPYLRSDLKKADKATSKRFANLPEVLDNLDLSEWVYT